MKVKKKIDTIEKSNGDITPEHAAAYSKSYRRARAAGYRHEGAHKIASIDAPIDAAKNKAHRELGMVKRVKIKAGELASPEHEIRGYARGLGITAVAGTGATALTALAHSDIDTTAIGMAAGGAAGALALGGAAKRALQRKIAAKGQRKPIKESETDTVSENIISNLYANTFAKSAGRAKNAAQRELERKRKEVKRNTEANRKELERKRNAATAARNTLNNKV